MYVWGVNSTVTKHSDYFVWKDMSGRVARRCDDTVDKKQMSFSVLKHIFSEGIEQPKNLTKNPSKKGVEQPKKSYKQEMLFPTRS